MIKILVTGGAGFIGSHTCILLLKNGYEVVIIDSFINSDKKVINRLKDICILKKIDFNKLHVYNYDLTNISLIEKVFIKESQSGNPIRGVIHFAGLKSVSESVKKPTLYWNNNITSSINLLSTMEKFECFNIVFSSSATVYGKSDENLIDEDSHLKPCNPYGSTKLAIEILLEEVYNSLSNKWSIAKLRYFNPIGAHPTGLIGESPIGLPNNIFPLILNKAYEKKECLKIFGGDWPTIDGTGVRDYIHVMDVAEGHLKTLKYLLLNTNKKITLNLGTGKGTSVLQLINIFQDSNNVKLPFEISSRRKGDLAKVIANNQLALSTLNWMPKKSLVDMCRDGWNWKIKNPYGYS